LTHVARRAQPKGEHRRWEYPEIHSNPIGKNEIDNQQLNEKGDCAEDKSDGLDECGNWTLEFFTAQDSE
jgi:hypothetical protein